MKSTDSNLNEMETRVLQWVLAGEHPDLVVLRQQLDGLSVRKREFTGVGFYTFLNVTPEAPKFKKSGRMVRMVIEDVHADISGLEYGAGFLLFVKDGKLDFIECFIYEDCWPENAEIKRLYYLHPVEPGSINLIETKTRDLDWALSGSHNELNNDIEESVYQKMMEELEHSPELDKDGFSLLLYRHELETRSFYRQFKNDPDVELLWTGYCGPKILRFLKFLSYHSGLLKIKNFKKANEIIGKNLGEKGVLFFFIPEEKEREIIKWSKDARRLWDYRYIFQGLEEYFYMNISCNYDDTDDELTFTYFRVLNYGERLSKELKDILTATK